MNEVKEMSVEDLWRKPILNLDECGKILGCSRNTIYRLRDEGKLRTTRPDGMRAYLVERDELKRYIAEGYPNEKVAEDGIFRREI
ncbi:MAG: hypothetical protein CL778_02825 [Chloroflexi bacterium]|nr:hypothetical protein [Chloroflexota bacterium]MBK32261.1 hypothetical protein [Chloroflexota bacterium]|tara:strand:- start:6163 stop:6417 length:255 start_codon:yes stop_codon:yes gene_type:complete